MERARQSMSTREQDLATFLSELHRRLETTAELEKTLRNKVTELAEREKALAKDAEKREAAKLKESPHPDTVRVGKADRRVRRLAEPVAKMGAGIKAGPVVARRRTCRRDGMRRTDHVWRRELHRDVRGPVIVRQHRDVQGAALRRSMRISRPAQIASCGFCTCHASSCCCDALARRAGRREQQHRSPRRKDTGQQIRNRSQT